MAAVKWTEKYRPDTLAQVLGNGKAIEELRAWAESWEQGAPITGAAILYGPAGTGKTSAALALAREFDWDIIEMNASDARTAGMIQKIAGPASQSMTFSGKPRLVVLDEADNLHGTADRGGAAAMLKLVRDTRQPVLLIANEYYEIEKPLRDAIKGIQFRSVRSTTIAQALREICKAEGVACDPDALHAHRRAGGGRHALRDQRSAGGSRGLEGAEAGGRGHCGAGCQVVHLQGSGGHLQGRECPRGPAGVLRSGREPGGSDQLGGREPAAGLCRRAISARATSAWPGRMSSWAA